MNNMENEIKEIINEIAPDINVNDSNVNLAEEMESMDIIALITELEDRFDINITMRDKTEENFKNVSTLATMVSSLK